MVHDNLLLMFPKFTGRVLREPWYYPAAKPCQIVLLSR